MDTNEPSAAVSFELCLAYLVSRSVSTEIKAVALRSRVGVRKQNREVTTSALRLPIHAVTMGQVRHATATATASEYAPSDLRRHGFYFFYQVASIF